MSFGAKSKQNAGANFDLFNPSTHTEPPALRQALNSKLTPFSATFTAYLACVKTLNMSPVFDRYVSALYQHRHQVLIVWLLVLISGLGWLFISPAELTESETIATRGTEAWQVRETYLTEFGRKMGSNAAIVLPRGTDTAELQQRLKQRFVQIAKITPVQREQARLELLNIEFKPQLPSFEVEALTALLRAEIKAWGHAHKLNPLLTGQSTFQYDSKLASKQDSRQSEIIALVIALVILVFNFGSVSAALLPLLMGISGILLLTVLIRLLGWSVNPVSRILTSLVGLALSIDYALFIVSRFREELRQHPVAAALRLSLLPSGRTILYSGLIMLCSLGALLIPDVSVSRTVVKHLLLVILIALGQALIVLPVLLAMTASWMSWPQFLSVRLLGFDTYERWRSFSAHVIKHYKLYLLLSLSVLGLLSLPILRMQLWEPVQSAAPPRAESMQAFQQLVEDGWGGELLPVMLMVQNPHGTVYEADFIKYLHQLAGYLETRPEVLKVQGLVNASRPLSEYQSLYSSVQALGFMGLDQSLQSVVNVQAGSNKTVLYVFPRHTLDHEATHRLLDITRTYAREHPEYVVLTGGMVARLQDFTHELYRHTGWILFLIMSGVYLLLWWHMKTLVLPLKAAIMNFLPIMSAFGVLTLIFQDGWGQSLLHTPFNGAVTHTVPIVLFCIVFGLSMDYEVLILSRVTEEYRRHGDVREALIEGLARSGSVITGAVLILLGVFLPGCFSSSPQTQEICIGITAAILLDATVVRLFLVPSFMMLMGRWNWWQPGRAGREDYWT